MSESSTNNFASLGLSQAQLANLTRLGFETMTPIQAESLPHILKYKDVLGQAKTGSGKTAAFGLGLLNRVDPQKFSVQGLVLCPTRELADQVAKDLRLLAQATGNIKLVVLCGGKPFGPQKTSLQHGAQVVVGTPGRLLDHLSKNTLSLKHLQTLVLDEADRMLDMGFSEAVEQIVERTPKKRQTLLFSATYPDSIKKLSHVIQRSPINVTVEAKHEPEVIEQLFFEVAKHERNNALCAIFEHYQPESTLVFCHTKQQCRDVAALLNQHQIQALAIHGDLDQKDRDRVMLRFANRSCAVLVATDVASRGLDIKTLELVINYELPRDPEIYVHRIGRTGRAGERGMALSLFTQAEQVRVNAIEAYLDAPAICDFPESLDRHPTTKLYAPMTTIEINAGRKNKVRPGDVLGALTGDAGLPGAAIGKIDIFDMVSFVAVETGLAQQAIGYLNGGRMKGRAVRARRLA